MTSYTARPPLLPWSPQTWLQRWSSQARLSTKAIPRTPFLLLKAPASTLYEEKFGGDRNMFTVAMYCSRMMARSIRVGCVIDCTALDLEEFEPLPAAAKSGAFDRRVRYFHNQSEWDDYDVEYHRLLPPSSSSSSNGSGGHEENDQSGSDEPLAPQIIPQFISIISSFLQKSRQTSTSNSNVTHISLFDSRGGCGAAAYLAAAYMCQTMRAPVHAALEAVKEGTPPQEDKKWGLCDVRLIKDLQRRFKGRKQIVLEGGVPSWWWAMEEEAEEDDDEEDDDDANLEYRDENEDSGEKENYKKRKRPQKEEKILIPPFDPAAEHSQSANKRPRTESSALYPAVPNDILEPVSKDSPKRTRALTVLAQLTQSSPSSPQPSALPTKLPLRPETDLASLMTSNSSILASIRSNPQNYRVTWLSTKGRRGLLLILSEAVYFIEHPSSSTPISVSIVASIKFPSPKDTSRTQHRTLLDVVLVTDREKNNQILRFYVLDILCHEGGMIWHKPFEQRWRFLNEGLLLPRKKDEAHRRSQGGHNSYAAEKIKIRAKEYFPLRKLGFVTGDVCKGVGHEAEGVVIIPVGGYRVSERNGTVDSVTAAVWKKGGEVSEENLLSLMLR